MAVSPWGAVVYISAINSTTSPVDYNDIKLNVGPFMVPVLPTQPSPANSLVGGQISVETLGTFFLQRMNTRKIPGS